MGSQELDTTEQLNHYYLLSLYFCSLVAQLYLFRDSMNRSPPGSSVHGVSQTKILEWVAISFSRGSSQPRDQNHVSCISRRILYH